MPDEIKLSDSEQAFLTTLRRLPDSVILLILGKANAGDLDPDAPSSCVCGWAVRGTIADLHNHGLSPEDVDAFNPSQHLPDLFPKRDYYELYDPPETLAKLYEGSTEQEWRNIFSGVVSSIRQTRLDIDTAFTVRVMEIPQPGEAIAVPSVTAPIPEDDDYYESYDDGFGDDFD